MRSCPQTLNQRDNRGFTALHRAAYLAHHDGYLEIYEYLLVRVCRHTRRESEKEAPLRRLLAPAQSEGADPSILSEDFDPYLFPGRHAPVELAEDETNEARARGWRRLLRRP